MDRLTTRIAGEAAMAPEHEEKHTIPEWLDMLHERLAAYEDTGLMPGEVLALYQVWKIADGQPEEPDTQIRSDCDNCGAARTCQYVPRVGSICRINCPLWKQKG